MAATPYGLLQVEDLVSRKKIYPFCNKLDLEVPSKRREELRR
jgi:hypothetical protein